jgi:hypothetical protein
MIKKRIRIKDKMKQLERTRNELDGSGVELNTEGI